MRHHLVAGEGPGRCLESPLFFGEVEIHVATDNGGPGAGQRTKRWPHQDIDGVQMVTWFRPAFLAA